MPVRSSIRAAGSSNPLYQGAGTSGNNPLHKDT